MADIHFSFGKILVLIGLLMVGGEFALPGMFMGALGVTLMITGFLMDMSVFPSYVNYAVALVSGVVSMLLFRKLAEVFRPKYVSAGAEQLVGKTAVVVKEISSSKMGQVKIEGEVWSVSSSGEEIPQGSEVRIIGYEGVHLIAEALR